MNDRSLRIPDYAGNNFFNTIGNLMEEPEVGLLFIDFETGGLLHVSGHATIDWSGNYASDPDARRMIDIDIQEVVERRSALRLRWAKPENGLIPLTVARKVDEADGIASIYLLGPTSRPLPSFEAGLHLPVEFDVPGQSARIKRSYSLSGPPGAAFYRLSIKREDGGIASGFVHDAIKPGNSIFAGKPAGDFRIPDDRCPLVLISAGIGVTPMMSMLHKVSDETHDRPVWFFHGKRDGRHHALKEETAALVRNRQKMLACIAYSAPRSVDREGQDYQHRGRITSALILGANPGPNAHYMLCGPASFLSDIAAGLEAAGIGADFIHFETFGPVG